MYSSSRRPVFRGCSVPADSCASTTDRLLATRGVILSATAEPRRGVARRVGVRLRTPRPTLTRAGARFTLVRRRRSGFRASDEGKTRADGTPAPGGGMTEPIYAQRYGAKRRLPAGRADAAYAGRDAAGAAGGRHRGPAARPRRLPAHHGRGRLRAPPRPRRRSSTRGARAASASSSPRIRAGRRGDCWPRGGPLPVAGAALTAASAAAGLAALHERGVVHGGVDPTHASSAARTAPSSSPAPAWRRRSRRRTCGPAPRPTWRGT